MGPFLPAGRPSPDELKGRGVAWRRSRGSRERRSLVIPRERSFLVARGTEGPAHSRKARSAFRTTTGLVAGTAGTPRGNAARGHHREQRDRGAWFERRNASFVSAGNLRFPACGQNPSDSGTITRERRSLERQRVPGSEATASPRAVRAGRARRFQRLEFAARSAAHGPRADVERAEGFLDSSILIRTYGARGRYVYATSPAVADDDEPGPGE